MEPSNDEHVEVQNAPPDASPSTDELINTVKSLEERIDNLQLDVESLKTELRRRNAGY